MSRGGLVAGSAIFSLLLAGCSAPFTSAAETEGGAGAGGQGAGSGGVLASGGRVGGEVMGGKSAGGEALEAGTHSGGANGGSGGGAALRCPDLPGGELVLAGDFCIDEVEVTSAHYQAFVASKPSILAQVPACLGNTTFGNACKSDDPEREPVRCVDWCDANAYCASVGKRLCGSTEDAGGAMPFDAAPTALSGQWFAACSHAGERQYPYGDAYDESACWGADQPLVGAPTVKSAPGCTGGYEGLFDMSGGLAEWVDSCKAETGMTDACRIRGGAYTATAEQMRCDWQTASSRDTVSNYIGFRCCADSTEQP